MNKKFYINSDKSLSKLLSDKDVCDDFGELPSVTLEEGDDDGDIDMRCTDYGEAMDFFN